MSKKLNEFETIAVPDFITAKQMVFIVVVIEILIQSFALLINPTAWWTWQLLGFITATNLGAVILAISAQNSADKIGTVYQKVFTPDFYYTVKLLTDFRAMIDDEAAKEGKDIQDELGEIAPKLYGLARKYLDARYAQDFTIPPNLEELGITIDTNLDIENINDEELFGFKD
jgi:hypothetical protein